MVRNLLAITRIDAGALELRRDWVDLREIVERVVSAARRRGAAPAFDDRLAGRSAAGARRRDAGRAGDRQRGRQRRRSYTARNPCVGDGGEAFPPTGSALRVTDDGPGIAAEMLPQMFEKFVKARRRSAASTAGRDWSRSCYCQGYYGSAWRVDRGREPGCGRTWHADGVVLPAWGADMSGKDAGAGGGRRSGDPALSETRAGSQRL